MPPNNSARTEANLLTLAALGIVAYVSETLLHEAVGHGGACLATGGRITLLAPLYMRCSVVTLQMVAAGPGMNVLAGLASLLALRMVDAAALRHALWLSLMFNWLVAAGYLLVGAATGFGDWGVLFAGVRPSWTWRVPAALVAAFAYWEALRLTARSFVRFAGPDMGARLILVPAGAATLVALAAQLYGQGAEPLGIALAVGCTAFVGLSAFWAIDASAPSAAAPRIGFSAAWVLLGSIAAAVFVLAIGPGADLSAL